MAALAGRHPLSEAEAERMANDRRGAASRDEAPSTPFATAAFLHSLFDGLSGLIEIRSVPDKRSGPRGPARQYWFAGVAPLLAALPGIAADAEAAGRAVSFGVLPRRGRCGRASATLPGRTAWVDLDIRPGEEAEAQRRVAGLSPPPSVVVRSGRGLHLYWGMAEPTAPEALSSLSARLACALQADHAFDAARVLRLPGTWNVKGCWSGEEYRFDVTKASRCVVESATPERRYVPDDFAELPALQEKPPRGARDRSARRIAPLPVEVAGLIKADRRVRDLWESRGKTTGDRSNSGYDASFALALARKGVTDPDTLDAAVAARPTVGATSARDPRAVRRAVDWALGKVPVEAPEDPEDWFEKLVGDVASGKRDRAVLVGCLRAAGGFGTALQRHRLALRLGGQVAGSYARGVRCLECGALAVWWPVNPLRGAPVARCAADGCGWRRGLGALCEERGIDPLGCLLTA